VTYKNPHKLIFSFFFSGQEAKKRKKRKKEKKEKKKHPCEDKNASGIIWPRLHHHGANVLSSRPRFYRKNQKQSGGGKMKTARTQKERFKLKIWQHLHQSTQERRADVHTHR
jgi:hypothetical protein